MRTDLSNFMAPARPISHKKHAVEGSAGDGHGCGAASGVGRPPLAPPPPHTPGTLAIGVLRKGTRTFDNVQADKVRWWEGTPGHA